MIKAGILQALPACGTYSVSFWLPVTGRPFRAFFFSVFSFKKSLPGKAAKKRGKPDKLKVHP